MTQVVSGADKDAGTKPAPIMCRCGKSVRPVVFDPSRLLVAICHNVIGRPHWTTRQVRYASK